VAPPVAEAPGATQPILRDHHCPSCGAHLIPEAVYCPDCGENVASIAAARPSAPAFEPPMAPPVNDAPQAAKPAVGSHRCPSCGAHLIPEAVYCPDCGENVAGIAAARPAAPVFEPPMEPPVAEAPKAAEPAVHERRCPECGTQLIPEAIFCPECGTSVPAAPETAPDAAPAPLQPDEWVFPDEEPSLPEPAIHERRCPECGTQLIPEARFCPECGFDVRPRAVQPDEIGTADLGVDLSSDQPEEE